MRTFLVWFTFPLLAGELATARRAAAVGDWRTAEAAYRAAIAVCGPCSVQEKVELRAELADVLLQGGFPEAAVAQWRFAILDGRSQPVLAALAESGLAVALFTAGHKREAVDIWRKACPALDGFDVERAACRFNLAMAAGGNPWSEMEEWLPALLRVPSPTLRATALLQTAQAAAAAGEHGRARTLALQAESIVEKEIPATHPFHDQLWEVQARLAEARGALKEAKRFRGRVRKDRREGWDAGRVSVEELRRKPR